MATFTEQVREIVRSYGGAGKTISGVSSYAAE